MIKFFRRTYDNMNIQKKYTIAIMVAVLVPYIILTVAFSGTLYDMIIAGTISDAQEASATTEPLLADVISQMTDINKGIVNTTYYRRLFGQNLEEDYELVTMTTGKDANEFHDQMMALQDAGINVRIYLGVDEENPFYSAPSSKDVFLPMADAKGTYWHGIFQGSKISHLFCPASYLGSYEKANLGDCAYITYCTMSYMDEAFPCYVAIYYGSDRFLSIMEDEMKFSGGVSYIINEREEIITTTDSALSSTYRLSYYDIQKSLMSSNNFIERDVLGHSVYVAFYYIEAPGWFLVTVIPEEPLIYQGKNIIARFLVICLLFISLALAVGIMQAKSITTRISSVIEQMSEVKKGPPVPVPDSEVADEVGELISSYNFMAREIQELLEEQKRTAEELRIAEFNALQAQINPHFLYNTMDMINWMALSGKTKEVSEVVQSLSKFYKLTLSRKNKISTVADELEHVAIYVELQNRRYNDAIELVIDMPDELTKFEMPKLTLQPIVENAILHGILEKDEKCGTIIITGWVEDGDLCIIVSDDGVGIPEDQIGRVLSEEIIRESKGTNVAVSNIHRRLQILYGEKYGLTYSSQESQGTEVTIRIPQV